MAEEKPKRIRTWKEDPQKARARISKYQKANTVTYSPRFVIGKDDDIIAKLNSEPSKVNYLRRIIREDIEKENK